MTPSGSQGWLAKLRSLDRRIIIAVLAGTVVLISGITILLGGSPSSGPLNDQNVTGPVLLVPGYGGNTDSLTTLQAALQQAGRTAIIVSLPGNAEGDIDQQAQVLAQAVRAALTQASATTVDIVGYSAGGVVARDYVKRFGGKKTVRRVVTLGSPQHGTSVAALGARFQPGLCPTACQQLAPHSKLLNKLNSGDESPAGATWVSIYTAQDQVVTPPESAKLEGALNIKVQNVCPNASIDHGGLPTSGITVAMVLRELTVGSPVALTSGDCSSLGKE